MSNTNFINQQTLIQAGWLNDVNDAVYNAAGGTSGTVERTLQNKLTDIVSVKDYGAKGDGTTDDTTALQAAIDGAGVGATIVLVAGMNCVISTELLMRVAGQRLLAYGAKITRAAAFTGTAQIRVTATDVTIEGLELDGYAPDDAGITTNSGADGFTVRNCNIYNVAKGVSASTVSRVLIEGNRFTLCATGAMRVQNFDDTDDLTNIRVLNNQIDLSDQDPATSTTNAVLIRGTSTHPMRDVVVSGNRIVHVTDPTNTSALCCEFYAVYGGVFSDNYGKDGAMLVSLAICDGVTVDGNTSDGATAYAIEVGGCTNTVVSNNTIEGQGRLNYGIGLQGVVAGSGCVVSGNTIQGTTLYGVFVNDQWDDITISGNRVNITASATSQRGIFLQGSATTITNVTISGNILSGNGVGEKAIMLKSVLYATVSGNACPDWTENAVFLDGLSATTDEVTICGNTSKGLTSLAIAYTGTIGEKCISFGNAGYRRHSSSTSCNDLNLNKNLIECWGTGTPESNLPAGVGSIYHRTDGGAATCLYIKESGTGNTGWVAK